MMEIKQYIFGKTKRYSNLICFGFEKFESIHEEGVNHYFEKLSVKENLHYHLSRGFDEKLNKRRLSYLSKICYKGLNGEEEQ